ncbi:hypothetical protein ACU6U9_10565 [Pseudomonas sp. HK3]
MDILENCNTLEDAKPGLSGFARELRIVYDEASQFCAFDDVTAIADTSSFFQNLVDLIHSGFSNLAINYELLLTGEIGAIFVVALIPLLLGIFLEITLLVSHNRKEFKQEKRQQAKLKRTHGSMLAKAVADESKKTGWFYRSFTYVAFSAQFVLVMLFFVTAPEYDRDVWCDEHKTQYSILKSGLETERLQHSQRRANCEIRQAVVAINQSVDTLGDLFSKENNTTLIRLKKVSSSVNDSIAKLDSTKQTIDGFQEELQSANSNTKNVLETLNIMQDIAKQLGLSPVLNTRQQRLLEQGPIQEPMSAKTLPVMLQDIETQLAQRPEKSWYEAQFMTKQQWQNWVQEQQRKNNQLEQLLKQQAGAIDVIRQQQVTLTSEPMIQAIADKVVQSLTKQPLFPLMMAPPVNGNNP